MTISLAQQIDEVEHELHLRKGVYARLDAKDPSGKSKRDYHVTRMEAVKATLVWLQENEATIKRLMAGAT